MRKYFIYEGERQFSEIYWVVADVSESETCRS